MTPIEVKTYALPPVEEQEVLRYAACREASADVAALAQWAADTAAPALQGRVCWRESEVQVTGDRVCLGGAVWTSQKLAQHLAGCGKAVVFAATVGLELDRLIVRYGHLSPAKGLMLQALGAERVEALCNTFNEEIKTRYGSTQPRFSPGYGDLPLTAQREIFEMLECPKRIGLFLNESLLMSPTKSVTAIIGIGGEACAAAGCKACGKRDCTFRRDGT